MPDAHETPTNSPSPSALLSACFDGFRSGVDMGLDNPLAVGLHTHRERLAWRAGFLAGAKERSRLLRDTEHDHQRAVVALSSLAKHYEPALSMLYAVPNGGLRSKAQGGKLKAEGVKPGVPDLCLPVARGGHHGLYIELKRGRNGRTSCNQKWWIEQLRDGGYRAEVCNGWQRAAEVLCEYLA